MRDIGHHKQISNPISLTLTNSRQIMRAICCYEQVSNSIPKYNDWSADHNKKS